MKKNNRKYKYLISYGYNCKIKDIENANLKDMTLPGTGCMVLLSSFKIETEADVAKTNENLMDIVKLEDNVELVSVKMYSFNLLKE